MRGCRALTGKGEIPLHASTDPIYKDAQEWEVKVMAAYFPRLSWPKVPPEPQRKRVITHQRHI